jgi:hypothetical protein
MKGVKGVEPSTPYVKPQLNGIKKTNVNRDGIVSIVPGIRPWK